MFSKQTYSKKFMENYDNRQKKKKNLENIKNCQKINYTFFL